MLADAVLFLHSAVVLFIVAGLPLIYLGAACRWAWVRGWRWRAAHLGAIGLVAAESVLGIACPLTVWEDALRGHRPASGFVQRWVGRLLFFDLPAWVFVLAYTGFAALVVITWVAVPPVRPGAARPAR
jgi:Protein of Unknown function (DUF2784)